MARLEDAVSGLPAGRPGVRIGNLPELRPMLAANGAIGSVAASLIGAGARLVRAILFDKSEAANWALGWHQDRIIAVAERVEVDGFQHWNRKAGVLHVEPPLAILQSMVTLRIHLDPVDRDNAPLLIAPGSHRLGRIPEAEINGAVRRYGSHGCLADRGDIWAYATLVLHASEAARRPRRRRVLQVDYLGSALPGGLRVRAV